MNLEKQILEKLFKEDFDDTSSESIKQDIVYGIILKLPKLHLEKTLKNVHRFDVDFACGYLKNFLGIEDNEIERA